MVESAEDFRTVLGIVVDYRKLVEVDRDEHGWRLHLLRLCIQILLQRVSRKGHVLEAGIHFIEHDDIDRRLRGAAFQIFGRGDGGARRHRVRRRRLKVQNGLGNPILGNAKIVASEIVPELTGMVRDNNIQDDETGRTYEIRRNRPLREFLSCTAPRQQRQCGGDQKEAAEEPRRIRHLFHPLGELRQ